VESLEDRRLLAVLDLTAPLAAGTLNGALFTNITLQSGTGILDPFLRVQASPAEQGYNSSFRPVQFDEDSNATWNHDLTLAEVPLVNFLGTYYREFLLDLNQTGGGGSLLSLNRLEIYTSASGGLTAYPFDDGTGPTATRVYDLDAGTAGIDTASPSTDGNWVLMDADLSSGSGKGDIRVFVPQANFAGFGPSTFVTLFSRFGDTAESNDGFEEWAVGIRDEVISGYKWADTNADGVWDAGEPGLNGWTVYLDLNENDQLDADEPVSVTANDGVNNGAFSFTNVQGEFTVREVVQAGYQQSYPAVEHIVAVSPDTSVQGRFEMTEPPNFGNYQDVTKSGYKWHDLNADGVWDGNEPGLNGWTVEVRDAAGQLVGSRRGGPACRQHGDGRRCPGRSGLLRIPSSAGYVHDF